MVLAIHFDQAIVRLGDHDSITIEAAGRDAVKRTVKFGASNNSRFGID